MITKKISLRLLFARFLRRLGTNSLLATPADLKRKKTVSHTHFKKKIEYIRLDLIKIY